MLKRLTIFVFAIAGSVSAQAPGISLRIETETGGTRFRMGEAIGLTLTFGNSSADSWMVAITGRDRSVLGLQSDGFPVSPAEGTRDPMRYLFGQGIAYSGPGGIFLRDTSAVAHVDLNQWIRFERAGFYRVHALFHARSAGGNVALESNDIGIEIVAADPEWQARQLRETVDILQTVKQDNETFETIMNAARRIGYLDTPASIREGGRLLGTAQIQVAGILKAGLLASGHRREAAAVLKQLMRSSGQAVPPIFLDTLAALDGGDGLQLQKDLADVAGQKSDEAQAISVKTLIGLAPEGPAAAALRRETARLFSKLPEGQQSELLGWQWNKIAGPDMIPVLRAIYDTTQGTMYGTPPIVAVAVERLYEQDPAQARDLILDEIRKPIPRLPFKTLAILPDATLPWMDKLMAEHLEQNDGSGELIARYATGSILEPVKAYYAKRDSMLRARDGVASPACEPALVAYFLRVDPAWGEHVLHESLTERGYPTGRCWMGILGRTASYYAGSVWEKTAVAALQDSTVVVKSDAVKALAQYGSAASKAPVWAAFRFWHEWWKGRQAEMNEENRRFEQVFLESIARAKNWNVTSEDLNGAKDFCITNDCSRRMEEYRRKRK